MRSESTLRRWKRDLRKLIDADENRETSRIAQAMEALLIAALSNRPSDHAWFHPVKDARLLARFLRTETGRDSQSLVPSPSDAPTGDVAPHSGIPGER